jgi:hypothetical protein
MRNSEVARKMRVGSSKFFNKRPEAMRLYFAVRRLDSKIKARLAKTERGFRVFKEKA